MGSFPSPSEGRNIQGGARAAPQMVLTPRRRPRLPSALLLLSTVTSVVSSLAFLGYLLVPTLHGAPARAQLTALYLVGLLGLGIAEGCQLGAILVLIGQWLAGTNTPKQFKELLILLLCLIPYMVVVVFFITLIVYLRARAHNPTSERTRDARQQLKDRTVDILVGEASDEIRPRAQAAAKARPTLRDAVRRVVGPATARSVSSSSQVLLALSLGTLLLSTLVSVGVVIPAHVLAPLQAGPTTSTSLRGVDWTSVIPGSELGCDGPTGPHLGTLVDALQFADVTGDTKPEAFVAIACVSSTESWPDRLEVFDGASDPAQPRRMATLLDEHEGTDGPNGYGLRMQSITVSGKVVTVVSRGWAPGECYACGDQRVIDTFTWNGSSFARGARSVTQMP